VFSVDQSTGYVSTNIQNSLTTSLWYDLRGDVIKTSVPGGLVYKRQYDGVGRPIVTYTTDGGGDYASGKADNWNSAASVGNNIVLSQVETQYDANGNAIFVTTRDRNHDETATGALGNATTGPKARVSY